MRKLYREFFYVPKYGKVRDKVMVTRLTMLAVIVVLSLAAMSLSAYAYFYSSITSGKNIIESAHFETDVSVRISSASGTEVTVLTSDHQSHKAELTGGQTYYITIQHTTRSTAKTGFVIITAEGCGNRYHTQQLGKDQAGNTERVTFYVKPTGNTTMTFRSHWGTSSYYAEFHDIGTNSELYILQGETVTIPITGAPAPVDKTPVTTPEATEPVVEETVPVTEPEETIPEETTPVEPAPTEIIHKVVEGETLKKIADLYGTTIDHLVAYNNIEDSNNILIGQDLKIPPADWIIPGTSAEALKDALNSENKTTN